MNWKIRLYIVKAEVSRELASGFGIDHEEIESLWNDFVKSLNCMVVESFTFDNKIADFASRSQLSYNKAVDYIELRKLLEEDV